MLEQLTAQQFLDSLGKNDIKIVALNLVAFVVGLLMHVWVKMRAENITFTQYWVSYASSSVASLVALSTTFLGLLAYAPDTPLYAFFALAYTGDSLINKAPTTVTAATRSLSFGDVSEKTTGLIGKLKEELNGENVTLVIEQVKAHKSWVAATIFVVVILFLELLK